MHRTSLRLELLEHRLLLAGDVPTFDDGVFSLPGTADQLASFEIRRIDPDVDSEDETTLVGFVPDDGNGSLDSLTSNERYDIKALARARHRIVHQGDENVEFKLKGGDFLSFGIIEEARLSDWLRSTTQQQVEPDVAFLYPVAEHDVAQVRASGNHAWEIRWEDGASTYTYQLQLKPTELEQDLLIESFLNSESVDDAPGLAVEAGDFVSRNFAVTNPGSVVLTNVVVTDDNGTPDDTSDDFNPLSNVLGNGFNLGDLNADGELDPGEVWLYSSPHTALAGQFSSRTVVTAQANGVPIEASDTANYFASSPDVVDIALIDVVPTPAPFEIGLVGVAPVYESGADYAFRPVVRNAGNVAVSGPIEVEATYRGGASSSLANETLQPGEELTLPAIEILEAEEGTFPIEFQLDPNGQIEETDESFEDSVWAADLEFAKPDVSIVDFVPTPTPLDRTELGQTPDYDLGQIYELRPIIENTGKIPVSGPFEVAINYKERILSVTAEQQLLPGQTLTLEPIEITEAEEGEFAIVFTFDPNDLFDESDESEDSNVFTAQLRFR